MGETLKIVRGRGNVFLDIGFSQDEAQNLHLRSELMNKIEHFVRSSGLTQKECAVRMGVTQPRLSDLPKGKIDKFSLDALVSMPGHAGMRVRLLAKKAARRYAMSNAFEPLHASYEKAKRLEEESRQEDRAALFENETLVIKVLQAVGAQHDSPSHRLPVEICPLVEFQ